MCDPRRGGISNLFDLFTGNEAENYLDNNILNFRLEIIEFLPRYGQAITAGNTVMGIQIQSSKSGTVGLSTIKCGETVKTGDLTRI